MRKSFSKILLLLFVLETIVTLAQSKHLTGVFLNEYDFRNKRVAYAKIIDKKYRFNPHNFFNTSFIKITIGDSIYTLKKDSIFGYRTKENISYRLFNKVEYEIINPNEAILIYSKTFFSGYKTNQITKYFFSISPNSKIYSLTKYNLKQVTIGDSLFHNQLDIYFRNDEDLLEYDSFYKIYKLNKIKSQ